jgi:hypothetical protein
MEYLRLAQERATQFPGIVLWYGVFAGTTLSSGLLSEFDGFGRRLAKELSYRDAFDESPRCDLSLQELEVLVGAARVPRGWRVANPGTLTVEIEPSIYVAFPWPFARAGDRYSRVARDHGAADEEQLPLLGDRTEEDDVGPASDEPPEPTSRKKGRRRSYEGEGRKR